MNTQKNNQWTILTVVGFYLVFYIVRYIEYFFIRTDSTLIGEAVLHKLAGIVLLILFARHCALPLSGIGFADQKAMKNLACGLGFGLGVFALAYAAEIMILVLQGNFKAVQFYVSSYAVDGNIGNRTGMVFFLICIAGNIINVLMEEGVFRGLFQKLLERQYQFISSAVIASILFGAWHMIGPVRSFIDGASSVEGMVANILMLVATSSLVGFKGALLTKMTGSLYMAMGDHFVNNTIVNILHTVSQTGADELMFVRITIAQAVSFTAVLIVYVRKFYRGLKKQSFQ